jgi:hypothetical protein
VKAEKIVKLANKYYGMLARGGHDQEKVDEDYVVAIGAEHDVRKVEAHLMWCCQQVKHYVNDEDQLAIAQQWVGFIQCGLWMLGFCSIEEMRQDDLETNGAGDLPVELES